MRVKAYFLDSSLGMVYYDFIGEFDLCFDPETLKKIRNAKRRGFHWRFELDDGTELTF